MPVGDEFKSILTEVGTPFTINRTTGDITGGHLEYDINKQATKPFTKEHNLFVELPYDTSVVVGDIITAFPGDIKWLVMHLNDEMLGNDVWSKSAIIYRVNVFFDYYVYTETGNKYKPSQSWVKTVSDIPGVILNKAYGSREADILDTPAEDVDRESTVAYVSNASGVEINGRMVAKGFINPHGPATVQNFLIANIDRFEYRGSFILYMKEDPRTS